MFDRVVNTCLQLRHSRHKKAQLNYVLKKIYTVALFLDLCLNYGFHVVSTQKGCSVSVGFKTIIFLSKKNSDVWQSLEYMPAIAKAMKLYSKNRVAT